MLDCSYHVHLFFFTVFFSVPLYFLYYVSSPCRIKHNVWGAVLKILSLFFPSTSALKLPNTSLFLAHSIDVLALSAKNPFYHLSLSSALVWNTKLSVSAVTILILSPCWGFITSKKNLYKCCWLRSKTLIPMNIGLSSCNLGFCFSTSAIFFMIWLCLNDGFLIHFMNFLSSLTISKSKCFLLSSMFFQKTALFNNLNISFSESFLAFFLLDVPNPMYGFNISFRSNLIALCIFFTFNPCFR